MYHTHMHTHTNTHIYTRPICRVLKRGVLHNYASVGMQGYTIGLCVCCLVTGVFLSIPSYQMLYKECFKGVFFKILSLSSYGAAGPGKVCIGKVWSGCYHKCLGFKLITKYGSTLYIGMDEVLANYACTFENSDLHFHFQ